MVDNLSFPIRNFILIKFCLQYMLWLTEMHCDLCDLCIILKCLVGLFVGVVHQPLMEHQRRIFSKFRVRDVIKTKHSFMVYRLNNSRSNFHHFMCTFCDIDSTLYGIPNHLNFLTGIMIPWFHQLLLFKDFLYKCACQVNLSGFISYRPRSWV